MIDECIPAHTHTHTQALQEAMAQHDHRLRNAGGIRAELQDILAWKESVAKHGNLLQERNDLDAQLQKVWCMYRTGAGGIELLCVLNEFLVISSRWSMSFLVCLC